MPIKSYLPVLNINNSEVKLSRFSFSAPPGSIGSRADVTVADVGEAISRGDEFDLTLKIPGGSEPKRKLIKDGRVIASDSNIAARRAAGLVLRNDSLSIVGIDTIAERWKLATRTPIILFDPAFVTIQESELDSNVIDEDGERIFATAVARESLDLDYLLDFVYVQKCGFDEVISNIPTYRIPRADFALNASFHSVATPFYNLFSPLVFEDDNRIFILDVYGEIPAGILSGARNVTVSKYLSYRKQEPEIAVVNAVLLTHRQPSPQINGLDELPANVTQRVDEEIEDSGTPGGAGWVRNTFKRYVAEFHEDEEVPSKITAEIVWKVETRTTTRDENGIVRELLVETQTDRYSNSWRLKLGYTKSTQAYVEDGVGGVLLQEVETETNELVWKPSIVHPGEYEKVSSKTRLEGLVLVDGGFTTDEFGNAFFEADTEATALLEASRNKAVLNDSTETIIRCPISTTTETWRYTGADQIEVHTQRINHLTGRVDAPPRTTEHIGTNAARVRDGELFSTKQVLLTDEDSDLEDGAREPITFDAGFVSYPIAKELALRARDLATNPRALVSAELASFDGGIRRGSIRNLIDRDSNSVTAIITGYRIEGLPVRQIIEGVVIG